MRTMHGGHALPQREPTTKTRQLGKLASPLEAELAQDTGDVVRGLLVVGATLPEKLSLLEHEVRW